MDRTGDLGSNSGIWIRLLVEAAVGRQGQGCRGNSKLRGAEYGQRFNLSFSVGIWIFLESFYTFFRILSMHPSIWPDHCSLLPKHTTQFAEKSGIYPLQLVPAVNFVCWRKSKRFIELDSESRHYRQTCNGHSGLQWWSVVQTKGRTSYDVDCCVLIHMRKDWLTICRNEWSVYASSRFPLHHGWLHCLSMEPLAILLNNPNYHNSQIRTTGQFLYS